MLRLEKALLSFDWQNIIVEEFEVWTLVPTAFEHKSISVLGSVCVCVYLKRTTFTVFTNKGRSFEESENLLLVLLFAGLLFSTS